MQVETIKDIDVAGKKVLVRVDFNVPFDVKTGDITDDNRIRASIPTIRYLIEKGSKTILCSHLGRPDGKVVEGLRLGVVAERLSQLLGQPISALKDSIGSEVETTIAKMNEGEVVLLENIRFYPEEEQNDDSFSQALAKLADVYVDDAFGTAHRSHASIVGVANILPSVAGMLLQKEIEALGAVMESPVRPLCGLLGGAKISDKVGMLDNIMDKTDVILIGGGMAATFLKALSYETGKSLIEENMLDTAVRIIKNARSTGVKVLFPSDVVIADEISNEAKVINTVPINEIPSHLRIVDIGQKTIEDFRKELSVCKTVFWNGPMGIYEYPGFAYGTKQIAEYLSGLDAVIIIGGGSTADAVGDLGLADKMSFVSTGGGATLKFLSGKALPGVEVLLKKT